MIRQSRGRSLQIATRLVGGCKRDRGDPRAKEIRIETDNDLGLLQAVLRQGAHAVGPEMGFANRGARDRIVNHVAGVGKTGQEGRDRGAGGRAGDRAGQESNRLTLAARLREPIASFPVHAFPVCCLPVFQRMPQTLAIVQPQDRRLSGSTQAAERQRMVGIAFELDGAPVAGLHEHAAAGVACPTGRSVQDSSAGNNTLRHRQRRDGVLHRRTLAASRQCAGEGEARQLQERTPAELSFGTGRLRRQFMFLHEFLNNDRPHSRWTATPCAPRFRPRGGPCGSGRTSPSTGRPTGESRPSSGLDHDIPGTPPWR